MAHAARGSAAACCAPLQARRARAAVNAPPLQPLRCAAAAAAASARLPPPRRPRRLSCAAPPAHAPRRLRCRAQAEGLVPHQSGGGADGDAPPLDPSKVASVQLPSARRRTQMSFTCNKCGTRSTRLVNPEALARGTVFVQCAFHSCAVWHKVADGFDWWGDEYTGLQSDGQGGPPADADADAAQ